MSRFLSNARVLTASAVLAVGLGVALVPAAHADHKADHQTPPGQADDSTAPGQDRDRDRGKSEGKGKKKGHAHAPGQTGEKPDKGKAKGKDKDHGPAGGNGNNGNSGNGDGGNGGNGNNGNDGNEGAGSEGGTDAGDPPGNNGTVKIAALGDLDSIPNNTPHPGCTFQVEWYGYDEGPDVVSTVTFAMHSPTADVGLSVSGPSQVFVGGDPATGAGTGTGLDGREAYTLAFAGAPHPKQGYHVRLTVATPRSQGNDTKTKVFWVEPCESADAPLADQTIDELADVTRNEDRATDDAVLGIFAGPQDAVGDEMSTEVATDASDVPTVVEAGAERENYSAIDSVTSPTGLLTIALGLLTAAAALVVRRRTQR